MTIPDVLTGQQIGDILIQEGLGQGGMAHVYKGLDLALKRPVAVKVIVADWPGSDSSTQRFEHEAQAVAALKHPNIVTVFQFGHQDRLYYLVMEYIDGVTLDTLLGNYASSNQLMPHADVLHILQAIGSALDYAHGQGVIHRDVKPSNIMLEQNGRPVLTDFGIALRVDQGTIGESFGSPHYIAPEQARSSANAVPQSDIYSLGVIAYEMLTGHVPFDDPSPVAIITQHLTAPVPAPQMFNRYLSEDVAWVLITALAKEPSQRFDSCERFYEELSLALLTLKDQKDQLEVTQPAGIALAPGVAQPTLSLQSAQDKLNQEMSLKRARGETITRQMKVQPALRGRKPIRPLSRRVIDVTVGLGVLVIFAMAGFAVVNAARSGSLLPAVSTPPAAIPTVKPNATASPHSAQQLFTLLWDNLALYGANQSDADIPVDNLTFERVLVSGGVGERYEGKRWGAYWRNVEVKKCVILRVTAAWQLPVNECPYGYNADVLALSNERFWTLAPDSVAFRVLWNGQEIALCQIAARRCNVYLPRAQAVNTVMNTVN